MSHQQSSNLCLFTQPTNEVWQKVRFVITWKRDTQSGRRPLYINRKWLNQTTYFILHMWVAHEFSIILNLMIVQRNGWMDINSLYDVIPSVLILVLYYSKNEVPVYNLDIFGDLSEESDHSIDSRVSH